MAESPWNEQNEAGHASNSTADLPLVGLKVLDLSRILAGPTATQLLGDFGATVIKVENPKSGGDDTRECSAAGDAPRRDDRAIWNLGREGDVPLLLLLRIAHPRDVDALVGAVHAGHECGKPSQGVYNPLDQVLHSGRDGVWGNQRCPTR